MWNFFADILEWIDDWHDVLLVVFTFALFAVTAGLVRFTKKLWGATSDLVRGAEETSKRELRAYIGMMGGEIVIRAGSSKHMAWVEFSNMGKTPAHDVVSWIDVGVRNDDPEDLPSSRDDLSGGVLVPNAVWRRHIDIPLHNLNMDTLGKKGNPNLVVFGQIDYLDIFEEQPCHVEFFYWAGAKQVRDGKYYWPLISDKNRSKATYGKPAVLRAHTHRTLPHVH